MSEKGTVLSEREPITPERLKRLYTNVHRVLDEDKSYASSVIALATGVLVGSDFPECAMMMLVLAEHEFGADDGWLVALRQTLGLEEVLRADT